jgi:hypothetical protein
MVKKIEEIQETKHRKEILITEIFEFHLTTEGSQEIEQAMTVKTGAEKTAEKEAGTEVDRAAERDIFPAHADASLPEVTAEIRGLEDLTNLTLTTTTTITTTTTQLTDVEDRTEDHEEASRTADLAQMTFQLIMWTPKLH